MLDDIEWKSEYLTILEQACTFEYYSFQITYTIISFHIRNKIPELERKELKHFEGKTYKLQ